MSSSPVPPRFVPTLTDVVQPGAMAETSRQASAWVPGAQREEQIVSRVMQRVDLVFERRLREAVGELILSQTQLLGPRLREEIEGLVRESVRQAVTQETATKNGGVP